MDKKLENEAPRAGRFPATVLFCDIRGFTTMFDQRDPLEALTFASSVLGALGDVVEANSGTIDKFTGDGFLAHFGITPPDRSHASDACRCAIEMRKALVKINSARFFENQPIVNIGLGIHSGLVAAGTIATKTKSEYTIIGSTVNLASRIEGLTNYFSVDCLLSTETADLLAGEFEIQKMQPRVLRGIKELVTTYWLLPMNV